jgi:sortase A
MRPLSATIRVLVAAVVVAALVALLLLLPGLRPGGPDVPPVRGAAEPPTFELVQRLRAQLAASAVDDPDYPFDPAHAALIATSPEEYVPLGRIAIDAIGLDVAYAAGVHPSVLERGPGHWPGSATPGLPGTAVLSGHRTTHTMPFGDLDLLRPGDPVVVTADGAAPVTYRVTETLVVPEAEYRQAVLAAPDDPAVRQLTLFACHPKGDRTHRIVVRATAPGTGVGR